MSVPPGWKVPDCKPIDQAALSRGLSEQQLEWLRTHLNLGPLRDIARLVALDQASSSEQRSTVHASAEKNAVAAS